MKVSAYGDITITIVNEPFSIHLSNEAQQFPTDENRKVSENLSYYTDVSVIKGEVSNPNFTIGEVKSANGITVSKNANRITFSVKAGVILPADSGSFDIPVTLDGETLIKTFSWSCQKSGAAAKSVKITASSTIFKSSDGGETYSPDTITLSPSLQGGISFSKWQYSVTGGSSWTDIKTGTHGFTISSTSLIVSKNCDLFTSETTSITLRCLSSNEKYYDTITIQKMRDGKDADTSGIDGRNRISFGSGEYQKGFFKNFSKTEQGYGEHTLTSKKQYSNVNLTDGFLLGCRDYKVGEKVTFSYDIMYTEWNFPTGSDRSEFWIGQRYTNSTDSSAIGTWRAVTMHNLPVVGEGGCKLGAWYHVEKTMTIPEQADESVGTTASIQFYNSSAEKEAKITFRMKNVKLEYGEKATDWSPAPEDNISSIKTLETIARKNTLDIETKVGKADFFKVINPDTGEDEKQTISEFMSTSTQNMYGFKREVKQQYDSLELGGVNLFVQNTTIQGKYLSSENVEIKDSACTTITPNTSWQRAITTFTVTDKTNSYYYISIVPTIYNQLSKNANFWVDGIMVEEVESLNSEPNEFTNSAKATIIDGNSILTDSITADKLTANSITAEKIMADALKSKNYVVGESGSFLNLADGSFDSKYLKWDNAGKVIANDITVVGGSINVNDKFIVNNDGIATLQGATVVGNITAESGKIGKFNLDNLALVTGDTDVTCAGLGGSSQAFWAGSLTMDDAPFRAGYDGSFYSSKGKIAGWEITSDSFYKDTDDYTVYVCPGTNNNKDFLTVHDKNKSSGDEWPFYVHADGWMHCVYGDIGGWNIGKNSINSSYSNTETTEYYVSDSFYSLSILSDSSKIISEFNEKKYSDSSKQKILSSESDSLTISGDSIQGTSRYILYGEETDKSGYSFLLSAYNGLEILDEVSEEGISYTGNHILFTRYNETVAEITEDKINSCHAGEVCHYYGNGYGDCGTNNNKYYDLSAFTTGGGKTFGSFHTKMSNEKIKINRTGVYCFQVRFSVNSGVNGSADKRVEFVPFVNNTRLPRYAASFSSRGNFSITNFQTYILSLNKGDVVAFDISPIEKVSVRVQIADIFVHVLDYVNKYADEYN